MSRSDQPLSQIIAGVNLVVISQASILRDADNLPVIAKDGSNGINVRFSDGTNKFHTDKLFWSKFSDFAKLKLVCEVDAKKPICKELLGKRLWLCVKEVKTMADAKEIASRYEIFDYILCDNPQTPPVLDVEFVEYEQDEIYKYKSEMGDLSKLKSVPLDFASDTLISKNVDNIAEKLAIGRKIIAEGEKKEVSSLNQKNVVKEEIVEDPFETELENTNPGESEDNNHVEDDWNDL